MESGIWVNRPLLLHQLFERYLQLSHEQGANNFGTIDFWDAILGNDNDDGWILESEYAQKGGGIPISEKDSNEMPASHYYELGEMFSKTTLRFRTSYGQYDFRYEENLSCI